MNIDFNDIITAGFYLGVIVIIVLVVQILYHYRLVAGEHSRKLTHILIALWMSVWMFYLAPIQIVYLGVCLILGIFIAQRFHMLSSIFDINRPTYGEPMFVMGVILTAIFFQHPAVYALAVINLGVADGFAAIIGTRYGGSDKSWLTRKLSVLGSTKTMIGMFTVIAVTIISGLIFHILAVSYYRPDIIFTIVHIVSTSVIIAGLEFIGTKGIDNLAIPLATGLLYSSLIV